MPLNLEVREALRPPLPDALLFPSKAGRAMTSRDVRRLVADYACQAKVEGRFTPHTLQHTFGTPAVRNGVDLASLAHLLGYENSQHHALLAPRLSASFGDD